MKKAYIEPKNTVVIIETEQFIAESLTQGTGVRGAESDARETVRSQDAWEEW